MHSLKWSFICELLKTFIFWIIVFFPDWPFLMRAVFHMQVTDTHSCDLHGGSWWSDQIRWFSHHLLQTKIERVCVSLINTENYIHNLLTEAFFFCIQNKPLEIQYLQTWSKPHKKSGFTLSAVEREPCSILLMRTLLLSATDAATLYKQLSDSNTCKMTAQT